MRWLGVAIAFAGCSCTASCDGGTKSDTGGTHTSTGGADAGGLDGASSGLGGFCVPQAAAGFGGERSEGGGGAGGANCPPLPGCHSTVTCTDQCTTCDCIDGAWRCRSDYANRTFCEPQEICFTEGELCGTDRACAPACVCSGGRWVCTEIPDCARECPSDPTVQGWWCEPFFQCMYQGENCQITACVCSLSVEMPRFWSCSTYEDCDASP